MTILLEPNTCWVYGVKNYFAVCIVMYLRWNYRWWCNILCNLPDLILILIKDNICNIYTLSRIVVNFNIVPKKINKCGLVLTFISPTLHYTQIAVIFLCISFCIVVMHDTIYIPVLYSVYTWLYTISWHCFVWTINNILRNYTEKHVYLHPLIKLFSLSPCSPY